MKRPLLILFSLSAAAIALAMASHASAADKPNVLFVVVDDLCCRMGCYGDKQALTPNMDRLAGRGVRFDRAYVQWTVCNPSRSSFLSSWRPDTTGIFENVTSMRKKFPDVMLLPQLFRQNGYYTASLGKVIHIGLNDKGQTPFYEDQKSWDLCQSFNETPAGKLGEERNLTGKVLKWCRWRTAEGNDLDQPDGQIANAAVKFLDQKRDQPFFLGVGFHKPHDPLIAPKKYFDKFPLDKIQVTRVPVDASPDLAIARNPKTVFSKFTDRERREYTRAYYACISFTDTQLGKVLDVLDRRKLWDNTIVVFISDHGFQLGDHDWWSKGLLYEHSARAPLIVYAPGQKGMGHSTSGIVEFVDIYPTLTALCKLKPPAGIQGKSFARLLDDPSLPGKSAAFTQVTSHSYMGRSIRTDRWRYSEWDQGREGVELYDHSQDPGEYHNLANDPQQKAIVAELREQLHQGSQ